LRAQLYQRIEPGHALHADVHDHDVRLVRLHQLHRLVAVGTLRHHREPGQLVDQRAQPGPHQSMVVDQQYAPVAHGLALIKTLITAPR
jgi:hypothetical protein